MPALWLGHERRRAPQGNPGTKAGAGSPKGNTGLAGRGLRAAAAEPEGWQWRWDASGDRPEDRATGTDALPQIRAQACM